MHAIQASRRQESGCAAREALGVIASIRIARTADANDVRHHPDWRFRVGIAPSGEIPSTSSILRGCPRVGGRHQPHRDAGSCGSSLAAPALPPAPSSACLRRGCRTLCNVVAASMRQEDYVGMSPSRRRCASSGLGRAVREARGALRFRLRGSRYTVRHPLFKLG